MSLLSFIGRIELFLSPLIQFLFISTGINLHIFQMDIFSILGHQRLTKNTVDVKKGTISSQLD